MTAPRAPLPVRRVLLVLACISVAFAAADTYVVVLAMPDMMGSVGLNLDELQRAAPIVSGFLLGYIAMLPLIGRIADIRGRVPVLIWSLVIFAIGSLITASSYDLTSMVSGRFLQGVGGGGLVPATLALVADMWPADRRAVPLGVVGAVQELGSVLGPLVGAVILAIADWQAIFWLNMAVGLILAAAILAIQRPSTAPPQQRAHRPDLLGALLAVATLTALALVLIEPGSLTRGITTGLAFIPYWGASRWATAMAIACYVLALLFALRILTAARPLVDIRGLWALRREADFVGALLLGLALAGVVLTFASSDPAVQLFSPLGVWFLCATVIFAALFAWRLRVTTTPLIPANALTDRTAWGSILVSFFVGVALIAALVDIPIYARLTAYGDSQLGASLVLLRLLIAIPVGALAGGYACRKIPTHIVAAVGMLLAAAGFLAMTFWGATSINTVGAITALVVCGLGFGLSIAPVNAALLAGTPHDVHGLASAFLVVARMVGMLIGVSALTAVGLRSFFSYKDRMPSIKELCGGSDLCDAYNAELKNAAIAQLHTIFQGAALAALIAAILSFVLLRKAETTSLTRP